MIDSMDILIVCVNYNSWDKLDTYLASLDRAIGCCSFNVNLKVIVADNSIERRSLKNRKWNFGVEHHYTSGNIGYLGGVCLGIQKEKSQLYNYDYVIISNVDLAVADNFFEILNKFDCKRDHIGCLAPSIFSFHENKNRNPKIQNRPTRMKMLFIKWMYQFPVLYYFYYHVIYAIRRNSVQNMTNRYIYAAHGSFLIFASSFIPFLESFSYPSFLFGEEIFFAENLRKMSLRTYYLEDLKVYDSDHESTGKLKRKQFFKWNYASIKILIKYYFNE